MRPPFPHVPQGRDPSPLPTAGKGLGAQGAGAERRPNSLRKVHIGKVGARVAGVLGHCPSPGAELGQTFATFLVSLATTSTTNISYCDFK